MERIRQLVADGETVPLFPAFRCMTSDTISDFAFGRSVGALELERFETDIFHSIDQATGSVPFVSHFPLSATGKGDFPGNNKLQLQSFPVLREALRWESYYNLSAVPNGFLELARAAEVGLR